eukprot:TRINITY_DN10378_c0_g1_i1.p1 TRINITY_DN10378_c0_g1~~TRINITY_DN10378_c0_g1_i1.p1  ORF type:complete len:467 (-),score=117.98 TRINITY_DN10378_c0_g1_i1:206-1606(-)
MTLPPNKLDLPFESAPAVMPEKPLSPEEEVLDQNDLLRKPLPKGPNSLARALSDGLYFNPSHAEEIQVLITDRLKTLIATNAMPPRLQFLNNNLGLWRDYANNPTLPGFEKITLEIFALIFESKVIVYNVSEDKYLHALVINQNKYKSGIELIKSSGNHFEAVFSSAAWASVYASREIGTEASKTMDKTVKVARTEVFDNKARIPEETEEKRLHKKSKSFEIPMHTEDEIDQPKSATFVDQEVKRQMAFLDEGEEATKTRRRREADIPERVQRRPGEAVSMGILEKEKPREMPSQQPMSMIFPSQAPPGLGSSLPERPKLMSKSPIFDFTTDEHLLNRRGATGTPTTSGTLVTPMRYIALGNIAAEAAKAPVGEKRKPIILDEGKERFTGRVKFFDEAKNYGFIIMDSDGSDIFVHYDDLSKANISKELLRSARQGTSIRLSFGCMNYIGKYNKSRKAVDIQMLAE